MGAKGEGADGQDERRERRRRGNYVGRKKNSDKERIREKKKEERG